MTKFSSAYDFGGDEIDDQAADVPLAFCSIDAWSRQEPPPREWAVPDRFPLRNVALISGEGAVGKSILIMQLGVAHALGPGLARHTARARPIPLPQRGG